MREVKTKIFILQVKINDEKYYLADLSMTLSRNFKDSVIFNSKSSIQAFDGVIERELEEKYKAVVTCKAIEVELTELFEEKEAKLEEFISKIKNKEITLND